MISNEIPYRLKPLYIYAAAFAGFGSVESFLKFELPQSFGSIFNYIIFNSYNEEHLKIILANPRVFWDSIILASEYYKENIIPDPIVGNSTFLEEVQRILQDEMNKKHGA